MKDKLLIGFSEINLTPDRRVSLSGQFAPRISDSVETHVIRFGYVAIATNPFELFLDYGNQMRARSLAAQTFIVQLACGSEGYLPTARAERGGHYSAYVSSGITGHAGGDLLVRHTLAAINALFPLTNA